MVYVVSSRIVWARKRERLASKKQTQETTSRKTKQSSLFFFLGPFLVPCLFFGGGLFLRQILTL